jgi:hypothetical protein
MAPLLRRLTDVRQPSLIYLRQLCRHDRHRLDRGGNRQINRALHIIAITRGQRDPESRAYLQRKRAEGKSRMETLRCLKRIKPAINLARDRGHSVRARDRPL